MKPKHFRKKPPGLLNLFSLILDGILGRKIEKNQTHQYLGRREFLGCVRTWFISAVSGSINLQ